MVAASQTKSSIFYGWVILTASFLTVTVARGIILSFGVFLVALVDQFNWSRGSIAAASSLGWVVLTIFSPLGGILMDRFGPRLLFTLGSALFALGIFGTGQIESLWTLYLFYGVIAAIGQAFLWDGVQVANVSAWFVSQRGLAVGLILAAWGVGAIIFAPLSQFLIAKFSYSWALSLLAMMVVVALIPLNALLQRWPETRLTASPRRVEGPKHSKIVDEKWVSQEWTLAKALRTYRLWSLWGSLFFGFMPFMLIVTHLVAALSDAGYARIWAATVFGIFSISNSAGQVFWGFFSDRFGREVSFTLASIMVIIGIAALMLVRDSTAPWLVYLHATTFGFGQASRASIFNTTSADLFYGKWFGSINGFIFSGHGAGFVIAPWLGGYIFDLTGSYHLAFILAISFVIISSILMWVTAPRKVRAMRWRLVEATRDIGDR